MILQKTLEYVAELHKITIDELMKIPNGKKRMYHDDISIAVVKLAGVNQFLNQNRRDLEL